MAKLLIAALAAATLGSSAQAAVTPQDRAWVDKMSFAVNDALNQSDAAAPKVGVVYVPVTVVDAAGHIKVAAPVQSCGCPDLDQAAFDALSAMGTAPRPPADLIGRQILVKAMFKAEPTHGDLTRAAVAKCG